MSNFYSICYSSRRVGTNGNLTSSLKEEADRVRERAKQERRSASSYLLQIAMMWVEFEEKQACRLLAFPEINRTRAGHPDLPRRRQGKTGLSVK
jgi:hypothetical protein